MRKSIFCFLYVVIVLICYGCTGQTGTEKHQGKRNNIVNVRHRIKEIIIDDDILINGYATPYIMGNTMFIVDHKSHDYQIHIFDKGNYKYLASTALRGEGPDEITRIGAIGTDETNGLFYVTDHGKQKIFAYNLDSVLINPEYKHWVKMQVDQSRFPDKYKYINDTLCIGIAIEPLGYNDFKPTVAKWNMNTGDIRLMEYTHPEIEKKRICFGVSMEHGIYVEGYHYHDLMSICTLDGKLKYNIYGQRWSNAKSNAVLHYLKMDICKDKIVAAYSGEDNSLHGFYATCFLIFDLNGDYIQTLDTGYRIDHFCYDKDNNRILLSLDDEIQFAYLDMAGII